MTLSGVLARPASDALLDLLRAIWRQGSRGYWFVEQSRLTAPRGQQCPRDRIGDIADRFEDIADRVSVDII
jgi:hypothetical protein